MSFVVWAALAVAGLVVGPIVAHLLRRGRAREREFPATALVPPLTSTARQRSRLEDWPLLVLRSAMIVGLAILGATPLVRCERLSLARASGASLALALVLDDSLSMRAKLPDGKVRWTVAKAGAAELLQSVRDGDAVTIVLAGRPARIALAPTADLGAAERILDELVPSDRATDLPEAVQLARAAVRALPQKDHRVVVLSDLAGDPIPAGSPVASTPLGELAAKAPDCGIASAERRGSHVSVSVACSTEEVARGRTVEISVAAGDRPTTAPDGGASRAPGDVLGSAALSPRHGEQTVDVTVDPARVRLDAKLTGGDALEEDNRAPVSDASATPIVGVVADEVSAGAKTGGATVVEQALDALAEGWTVRPLPFIPDDERGLGDMGALVIDDPRGLSPEARDAITHFLERGGVALALLGPRSTRTELGGTLEPFARGALRWEEARELGIEPSSVSWLGPEGATLDKLTRHGRVRLDDAAIPGARVVGRWSDEVPWLLERHVGRGLAFTAGLPASLDDSDLAVRPGFLAILDYMLRQADQRGGARRTVAGTPWTFPDARQVVIDGPPGKVATAPEPSDEACIERGARPGCGDTVLRAVPGELGRYSVHIDGGAETRVVTVDPAEILAEPRPGSTASESETGTRTASVNVSREVALALIALFAAELALRIGRKWAERRRDDPSPST